MNLHTFFINSMVAKINDPSIQIFSLDLETGCLGFLNVNNAALPLLSYALFASFFGSAGYVLCLLFYSPLVTSNAYLVEPFFAQILGYIFGLDQLPGWFTALGTLFAIFGIAFIDKGSRKRLKSQSSKLNYSTKNTVSDFVL